MIRDIEDCREVHLGHGTVGVDGLETDLKINEFIFDIEFELIKEKI